jgi:hypothetical protein
MNSNHGEVTEGRKLSSINVSERTERHMPHSAQSSTVRGALRGIFERRKPRLTGTELNTRRLRLHLEFIKA